MSWEDFIRASYEIRGTTRTDEIRIHCPFCNDDKFHGYVSTSKEVFKCMRCKARQGPGKRGYSAYNFLKDVHRLSSGQIMGILRGEDEISSLVAATKGDKLADVVERLSEATEEPAEVEVKEVKLPDYYLIDPSSTTTVNLMAWNYIKKRLGKRAEFWNDVLNFGFCMRGPYSGRILLPVYDHGKLIYFQGRAFMPPTLNPPYLNPSIERPLFSPVGYMDKLIILCEGYFDALAIGRNAVSVFGSNLTDKQLKEIIGQAPERVIICFDDDEAGRHGMVETRTRLRPYIKDIQAVVGLARDPGDIGPEVRKLINNCAVDFNDELEVVLALG